MAAILSHFAKHPTIKVESNVTLAFAKRMDASEWLSTRMPMQYQMMMMVMQNMQGQQQAHAHPPESISAAVAAALARAETAEKAAAESAQRSAEVAEKAAADARIRTCTIEQEQRITAQVLRDGVLSEIDANELVPGDIVKVQNGPVPCDLVLLRGAAVCDESTLTGESMPVQRLTPAPGPWVGVRRQTASLRPEVLRSRSLLPEAQGQLLQTLKGMIFQSRLAATEEEACQNRPARTQLHVVRIRP
eukprot:s93_g26.t1